ncbi:MAG: MiaB/RimO family radical SAM methylthiotransferase [Coriobacteriales bacterium]|nr:MiaB/RimO family radical SAM methylthiotransferase [Coriobacteriales bacterium]
MTDAPLGPAFEQSAPRVALVNLGCRVNRVEIDLIASRLEQAGCEICDQEDADLVVINTCAVTGEAQSKTRKAVRHAAQLEQRPIVVATGCVANLFADELRAAAPGVVVERDKRAVADRALSELGWSERAPFEHGHLAVAPTPTGRTRPGIKIQDGCDNRCSFCIVWKARGPSRSLASRDIVAAVEEACRRGAHEVVLTGINLGSYRAGADDELAEGARLDALLAHLLEVTGIERIRLSSIEPPDVTNELLDVMAASDGRVAPFLHVCLQSGCDATLSRMRRVYDTADFRDLVQRARARMPKIALGTDLIVGFPGETDGEFAQSYAFCEEMAFARMHVFRYSKRPGTPAAVAPDQVAAQVSARRGGQMRALARQMRAQQAALLDGDLDLVLVQGAGTAVNAQLFDVEVLPTLPLGALVPVRLQYVGGDRLKGLSAE